MSTEPNGIRPRSLRRRALAGAAIACLPLTVAAVAGATKPVKGPIKGSAYGGTTSEHGAVTFMVSKNGKRIVNFKTNLGYNGHCGQGGGPGYEIQISSIAIGPGGKFQAKTKGTFPNAAAHVTPVTVKVSGHIAGTKAAGAVIDPGNVCSAPHKGVLPYSETFTAGVGAL